MNLNTPAFDEQRLNNIKQSAQAVMKKIKDKSIDLSAVDSGFSSKDVNSLWYAAEQFVDKLADIAYFNHQLTDYENQLGINLGSWKHSLRLCPWGDILVTIPSNAVIPLSIILPIALIASNNRITVVVSSITRKSGHYILESLKEVFPNSLVIYQGSVREAIQELIVPNSHIDCLYYIGSSAAYKDIASRCAENGVALIYEGEGRSIALIDENMERLELTTIAKNIIKAKVFCNGCMCSAPNVGLIPSSSFDYFKDTFRQLCLEYAKQHSQNKKLSENQIRRIKDCDSSIGSSSRIACHFDLSESLPFFWESEHKRALEVKELFSPGIILAEYPDFKEIVETIRSQKFRLQVSFFTHSETHFNNLLENTGFARYCVNMNPALQDPLFPWGNYGLSGYSDVIDFYRKGMRRVIIENSSI